ncbi:MAG: peptidoglycan-binding protein [Pseudomonadota bacterium]
MRAGSRRSARLREGELRAAMRSAARESGLSLEEWIDEALDEGLDTDDARGRYRMPAEDRTATSLLNRRLDLIEDMLGDLAGGSRNHSRQTDDVVEQLTSILNNRQNSRASRSVRDLAGLLGEDLPVSRHAASDALRNISARLDQLAAKTPGNGGVDAVDDSIRRIEDQLEALAGRIDAGKSSTDAANQQAFSATDSLIDDHIRRLEQKLDSMAEKFAAENGQAGSGDGSPLRDMNAAVDQIMARQQAIEAGVAGIPEATAAAQANQFQADADAIREEISAIAGKIDAAKANNTDAIDRRLQTLLQQIDTSTRSELTDMRSELRELAHTAERTLQDNERRYRESEARFDALAQQMEMPARSIAALEDKLATLAELLARAPDSQAGLSADLAARIDALSERINRANDSGVGGTGAANPELLAAVDRQLSSLGANIAEVRAQAVGRDVLTDVFERIAGQVEAVNSRLDDFLTANNTGGVETLGDKIDQLHAQLASFTNGGSVDTNALDQVRHSVEELSHRLSQAAANGTDADVLAHIQARIDDLARRADSAAQNVLDPSVIQALESRIADMAQHVSAICQDSSPGQVKLFESLSQQITNLSGQIEKQTGNPGTSEIKSVLSELAKRIESARAQAVDAAREAAQEIIIQGGDTGLVKELKADLEKLQAANAQATQRTEDSLGDMRNVLSSMVARMSAETGPDQRLEPSFGATDGMAGRSASESFGDAGSNPAGYSSQAPGEPPIPDHGDAGPQTVLPDSVNPAEAMTEVAGGDEEDGLIVREGPRANRNPKADPERDRIGDRLGNRINQMLNSDKAANNPTEQRDFEPQDEPIVAGIDGDTPLSPGSRQPTGGAIAGASEVDDLVGADALDAGRSKADNERMSGQANASDFIAAARRAAAEARQENGKGWTGKRRKAKGSKGEQPAKAPAKNSPLGRMRKPLVLASAALLLVVGSLKVYEMLNAGAPTASLIGTDGDVLDGGPDSLPQGIAPPASGLENSTVPQQDGDGAQSSVGQPGELESNSDDEAGSNPGENDDEAALTSPNRASRTVGSGFVPLPIPNVQVGAQTDEAGSTRLADASQSAPLTTGSVSGAGTEEGQSLTATQQGGTFVPGGFGVTEEGSGIFNDTLPEAIGTPALRKAAQEGDALAQHEVARRFSEGRAIPQDLEAAADWYQRAAAQGLAPAQYALATLYEKGNGVDQDVSMAEMWYKRAADQGNRKAMYNLAVMLSAGAKGTPDYTGAAPWFRRAAELGLRDSQFNLGVMHARGLGVNQDNIEAFKWFAVAAAQGDKEAINFRDKLAAELGDSDKERAMEIAQTWRPARLVQEANFVTLPAALTKGEFPRDPGLQEALDPEVVLRATQTLLNRLGYNAGAADGIMGPRTRNAIRSFERAIGWPETGRATPRLLNRMKQEAN